MWIDKVEPQGPHFRSHSRADVLRCGGEDEFWCSVEVVILQYANLYDNTQDQTVRDKLCRTSVLL